MIERIAGGQFLTFVKMSNIVAITEEEVEELHPENPNDAKIIDAIQKNVEPTQKPTMEKILENQIPSAGKFINPESLAKTSEMMKNIASES
ncbi:MAG: hypothetical protein ACW99G_00500 [Candidatus Thorarchaeota archaeon]